MVSWWFCKWKKKQQIPQVAQMVNGQKVRKYQKTQKNTCRKYTTHSNRNMSKLLFVQAQESRETICLLVISMNLRCCHLTKPRFYMIVLPLQLLQLTQDSEGTDILLSDFDVAIPMEKNTSFEKVVATLIASLQWNYRIWAHEEMIHLAWFPPDGHGHFLTS